MLKRTYQKIIAGLVAIYALLGFVILPLVLESQVPKIASEYSDGNLTLDAIHFNPFLFKLTIDGLLIQNPNQKEAISFKKFIINYEPSSLLMGKIHFKNLELQEPHVTVNRLEDGSFDFNWLVKHNENAAEVTAVENSETTPLPAIRIDKLKLVDGNVAYNDHTRKKAFSLHMGPIGFTLNDIDTADLETSDNALRLRTRLSDGGFLDIKSKILAVEPFAINGHISFESGKLFTEWRYLQEDMKLEVADGRAHLGLDFGFDGAAPEETYVDNIKFKVDHLRIKPKDAFQDVLRVNSIALNSKRIEPMKRRVRLESLDINGVAFYAKRYEDLTLDWMHYLSSDTTEKKRVEKHEEAGDANETTLPWDVHLEHFGIKKFEAHFDDAGVVPHEKFDIDDMNVTASNLSSKSNTPLKYQFNIKINQEMLCQSRGTVAHSPLDAQGHMKCDAIKVNWFDTYVKDAAKKSLQKYDLQLSQGSLAFGSDFKVVETNGSINANLSHAYTHLDDFLLKQASSQHALYRLKHFGVDEVGVDTHSQEVMITSLDYYSMWLYLERMKSGDINWNTIVVPKTSKASKKSKKVAAASSKPWHIKLKTLVMRDGKVEIKDRSLEQPLTHTLDKMYMKVRDIDSASRTYLKYYSSLRVNHKGSIKLQGRLRHTPLRNSGSITISNIALEDMNPYLEPSLYTNLKSGDFSLSSSINYAPSKTKPDLVADGKMAISDFIVNDAHDNSVLLAFSRLDVAPFHFELMPNSLFVNEIKIGGLYANAHIDQNRTMNFAQLQKGDVNASDTNTTEAAETNATEKSGMPIRIVKLKIENGNADFEDDSLPIPFNTHIHDLNGFVYGISSLQEETSYVKLDGIIDSYGSAKISGSLNSAKPRDYTDIDVVFRNIDLKNMSGYSGKFAGRKIDNGKLFLNLNYEILKSQMLGENSVVIKKMEFGDDVESEDAVSLPLDLAVALLEDNDGVIDIDMPVDGDLDNPDFKYGSVVWQVFSNLIVKAVSSPFKFLMGDDAENMQFIQFEPGMATLLPPEIEKLDNISKALSKRPKLALAVNGSFDMATDTYALQIAKLTALALDGEDKGEGETMTGERLKALYKKLLGDEALEAMQKRLEERYADNEDQFAREYQKTLIQDLAKAQTVTQEELDALADERARAIKSYLVMTRGVVDNRVVIKPSLQSEKEASSYVDTKLDLIASEDNQKN